MSRLRGIAAERGATAVEYALGLVLFVVVIMSGLQVVQRNAEDTYGDDRASISETENLGTVGSTTSTPSTVPGPTTTASTTTTAPDSTSTTSSTTTPVPSPTLEVDCIGAKCDFWVDSPPVGASYNWQGTNGAGNGTAQTFSHTREKNKGAYAVSVTLNGGWWSDTVNIFCSQGSNTTCEPS